jgi:hypothetical protein
VVCAPQVLRLKYKVGELSDWILLQSIDLKNARHTPFHNGVQVIDISFSSTSISQAAA